MNVYGYINYPFEILKLSIPFLVLSFTDATLRHGALTQAFSNFEKEHISSASGSMEAPTVRLESK